MADTQSCPGSLGPFNTAHLHPKATVLVCALCAHSSHNIMLKTTGFVHPPLTTPSPLFRTDDDRADHFQNPWEHTEPSSEAAIERIAAAVVQVRHASHCVPAALCEVKALQA